LKSRYLAIFLMLFAIFLFIKLFCLSDKFVFQLFFYRLIIRLNFYYYFYQELLNKKIMNRKTTLLSLKYLLVLAFTQVLNAQQIYTNGGLSTGATSSSGVAAPAGFTWSEVQSDTGNTTESNTLAGASGVFTTAGTNSVRNADDFIVPVGAIWNVTSVDIFVYQTGFVGAVPPVDQMRLQIFNGDPQSGGTLVAGDMTTNVINIAESSDALMYRLFNTTTPAPGTAPGTTRKIWQVRGNITASLPAGTYWIVYQLHSTNDGNSFFPPITIPGVRALPGWNAKQNVVASTAVGAVLGWAPLIDTGNPATAPDFPLDLPFTVNGTVLGVNENAFEASISLSPNPVKDVLSISVATGTTVSSYEIFDVNGKVVKALKATSSIYEINVSELAVGNYILRLQSDKGIASKKFIKE